MGIKKHLVMAGLAATALFSGIKTANADTPKESDNSARTQEIMTVDKGKSSIPKWIPTTKSGDLDLLAVSKIANDMNLKENLPLVHGYIDALNSGNDVDEAYAKMVKAIAGKNSQLAEILMSSRGVFDQSIETAKKSVGDVEPIMPVNNKIKDQSRSSLAGVILLGMAGATALSAVKGKTLTALALGLTLSGAAPSFCDWGKAGDFSTPNMASASIVQAYSDLYDYYKTGEMKHGGAWSKMATLQKVVQVQKAKTGGK